MGCRRDDSRATAARPSEILGLEVDHCMGMDVASPVVHHVVWLWRAREAGYSVGAVGDALAAEADLVVDLHEALRAAKAANG